MLYVIDLTETETKNASREDRTLDPWFTRPVLYHWAIEAPYKYKLFTFVEITIWIFPSQIKNNFWDFTTFTELWVGGVHAQWFVFQMPLITTTW